MNPNDDEAFYFELAVMHTPGYLLELQTHEELVEVGEAMSDMAIAHMYKYLESKGIKL